jgi:hypothetical protein
MRYMLALVTLGAALAVSAPAALACGDKVDCSIPLRPAQAVGPIHMVVHQPPAPAASVTPTGPTVPTPWWIEMRDQNRTR